MEPTLNINDRVLVVKNHIINSEIKPGDIVVFYSPDNPYIQNIGAEFIEGIKILWNFNSEESYLNAAIIKRVIGTGGDEILIKENISIREGMAEPKNINLVQNNTSVR